MLINLQHIGRKIIRLDTVDSTNNYTANLIKEGNLQHGTVILAVEQFAGKGQRGAEWLTEPGSNLTISVFLDEVNLSVDRQFSLTQFCSILMVNTLDKLGVKAEIKWPNDIYVDKKKIAGMLIENQLRGSQLRSSIVGIGLNVNQTNFGELQATSIRKEIGQFISIDDILASLISEFNSMLDSRSSLELINTLYHNNLYQLNERREYKVGELQREGIILGVLQNGKLKVKFEQEELFDLKEIEFMPQNVL